MKKTIVLTLLILGFLFTISKISFALWQPDVRLTNTPGASLTTYTLARCIAASGNVLHAVWTEDLEGNYEIYYKRSTDGGLSWGTDVRLTNDPAVSDHPSIVVSGSIVHIVWQERRARNNTYCDIYYKCSLDGGVTWGPDIRLTYSPFQSVNPSIAASGSNLHLVWEDNRNTNYEIYYKRSIDAGVSWGEDIRLTNNSNISELPSLAVSGSFVHVVWTEFPGIYYKRSTDGGINWEANKRLGDGNRPTLEVSGSDIHVVFGSVVNFNWNILYIRSSDNGISWGEGTWFCNTNEIRAVQNVSISVSGLFVHVVWTDGVIENMGLYYKRSIDGGITWEANKRLTNSLTEPGNPSIAISGSVVNVLWQDMRDGNWEIYYKRNPSGNMICNDISVNAGNDAEIFLGYGSQNVQLTATPSGGYEPYSYLWTPGGATTQSINVSPVTTTAYIVQITNSLQCSAIDTVMVYVYNPSCGNNGEKIMVCHNGVTICISPNAVPTHLAHGDKLGPCGDNPEIITSNLPTEFKLNPNYPNPFNPVTKISFDIPKQTFVTLKIYDMLGREVRTLVNEVKTPGNYLVDFNGSELSSGVYFYRLQSDEFTDIKRMLLIK